MSSSTCSLFRCGDTCIELNDSCMCGDESFGHKDNFWCCHDLGTCRLTNSSDLFNQGKRSPNFLGNLFLLKAHFTFGINIFVSFCSQDDPLVAVKCNGTKLKLTEPCREKCNIFPADEYRNYHGVIRAFVSCRTTVEGATITQCVPEAKVNDGSFNCRNR